ncbi:MAG: TIGR03663 family protein [Candidatus Alcyoniella australis]|nr:TIGR03663 family protein [Candidatus Alcyoniella australis]
MRKIGPIIAALAVLSLAAWLRFHGLDLRPVHHDESVNFEFVRWIIQGLGWSYDPAAYHGPLLYYAALPIWSYLTPSGVDKFALRLVPALFGMLTVLLALSGRRTLGAATALLAGLLLAVSPDQTFFSRMLIHEVLLAAASVGLIVAAAGAVLRNDLWSMRLVPVWAALALSAKETAAFLIIAVGLAAGLELLLQRRDPQREVSALELKARLAALAQGCLVAALIWGALFSSFGDNPRGLLDFFAAFALWGGTAGADHVKDFWYFFGMLQRHAWPLWLLSLPAVVEGIRGARLQRFLSVVALSVLLIYSGIPYKTPWCLVQITCCLSLLAASGIVVAWRMLCSMRLARAALVVFTAVGAGYMLCYCLALNFVMYTDNDEPLVYVQSQEDLEGAFALLYRAVQTSEQGWSLPVLVLEDKHPIPFYLRRFTTVDYHTEPPEQADSPIWICAWESYDELASGQWGWYHELLFQAWPGQFNAIGVRQDLWDRAWGRESIDLEVVIEVKPDSP